MFEAAYDLGKNLLKSDGMSPEESIYIDAEAAHIIVLKLGTDHQGIDIMEYDRRKHRRKYPFREGKGSGAAPVPTAILNQASPEKTLMKKLRGWFKNVSKKEDAPDIISEALEILDKNQDQLLEMISSKISSEMKNEKVLLTIEFIDENKQEQYAKFVDSNLLNSIFTKYYLKYDVSSKGMGECFYCGEIKEVYGFAAPLKFYTHDKITYSSNFDVSTTWNNFPVCGPCELIVEKGIWYIERELKFNFFGVSYILFPQLINSDETFDLVTTLKDEHEKRSEKDSKTRVSLTADENEILEELSEMQNMMTLSFLFFKKNNSQFEILNIIHDVLPSRLSELFDAKKQVENRDELGKWWLELPSKEKKHLDFNYGFLRNIFPKSLAGEGGQNDIYRAQFLEFTASSFKGTSIEPTSLIVPISRVLQHLIANRDSDNYNEITAYRSALQSLVLYEFFTLIGCIQRNENTMTENDLTEQLNIGKSQLAAKVIGLFDENSYFDHSTKKAAFITGILSYMVGVHQYWNLNSKPFYERFDGLRLTPRKIKRVFTDAIAKLHEYGADKMEVTSLQTLASHYYMKNGTEIGNEDLCFSFALGLSFGNAVWADYNKGENDE